MLEELVLDGSGGCIMVVVVSGGDVVGVVVGAMVEEDVDDVVGSIDVVVDDDVGKQNCPDSVTTSSVRGSPVSSEISIPSGFSSIQFPDGAPAKTS